MDKLKIYLSASQQPANTYADNAFTEEEVMHAYVKNNLYPLLEKTGKYDLKISNPKNDLYGNIAEGNAFTSYRGLYLSHHTNAATKQNDGLLVLTSGSYKSMLAARIMYDELSKVLPDSDEGIRIKKEFAELRRTASPALIIELYYHDNLQNMKDGMLHLQQYAEAEVRAIERIVPELMKL